jgi:hypothetical protein
MAFGSFEGQNGHFRRFWGISGNLWSGWRVLAQKTGSCKVWEIFGDFCGILEGLKWFRT